jgi:hypothetical protein
MDTAGRRIGEGVDGGSVLNPRQASARHLGLCGANPPRRREAEILARPVLTSPVAQCRDPLLAHLGERARKGLLILDEAERVPQSFRNPQTGGNGGSVHEFPT